MRVLDVRWRRWGALAVLVGGLALSADTQLPVASLPPGLAVLAVLAVGVLALTGGWMWRGYAQNLVVRAAQAEERLRRVSQATRDLADSLDSPEPCMADLVALSEAEALRVAALRGSLQQGVHPRAEQMLAGFEALADRREADLAAIEAGLAGAREELATTGVLLQDVAKLIEGLCARTGAPGGTAPRAGVVTGQPGSPSSPQGGRLYCDDLHGRLAEARQNLTAARGMLEAGESSKALRAGRRLRGRLADLRRTLESRQASLDWLESLPQDLEALEVERQRLNMAGYRGLPDVAVEALKAEAATALSAWVSGDLRRAGELEPVLRRRVEGLRHAVLGREALRRGNAQRMRASCEAIARLTARIAGSPGAEIRSRMQPAAWSSAARLEVRLVAKLRSADMTLRQAAQANHLDAQAFEEAAALLTQVDALLAPVDDEWQRSEAAWRLLLDEEMRLHRRLKEVEADVTAATAQAHTAGLAPGTGLAALLVAAREALFAVPTDLTTANRALGEAEAALTRMGEHLTTRPGAITLMPPGVETPQATWSERR